MKIVSPGVAVREAPEEIRRRRLGHLTCAMIVAGWATTALCAQLLGTHASRNAWLLAAIGAVTGLIWATKPWGELRDTSLQILLGAASLQAIAATIAFDRGVIAAWIFPLMLAMVVGQIGRTRLQLAGHATLLAGGTLLAGAVGPDRAPEALQIGAIVSAAVVLVAVASAGVREELLRRRRTVLGGDARMLHERLAEAVSADADRFALLTMDLRGLDRELVAEIQQTLIDQVRGRDVVARTSEEAFSIVAETDGEGAFALARRIEGALAGHDRADAAVGIALYPEDGRTPDELLASADVALAARRAANRRLHVVSPG
jgi:GGDEF domain-containing protein